MLLCCRQIRQSVRVHCFSDGGRVPSTSRRLWSEWTAALCPGNSRPAGGGRTAGRQADSFWRPRRFICHNVSLDGDTVGGRRRERALLAHYDRPRWPWSVIDVAAWRESVTLAAEHSVTHLIAADPPPPSTSIPSLLETLHSRHSGPRNKSFYPRDVMPARSLPSKYVCPSVRHTPVLYING